MQPLQGSTGPSPVGAPAQITEQINVSEINGTAVVIHVVACGGLQVTIVATAEGALQRAETLADGLRKASEYARRLNTGIVLPDGMQIANIIKGHDSTAG